MLNKLSFGFAILSTIALWIIYYLNFPTFPWFIGFYFITLALNFPKYALSPLTIFFAYYGAWFVVAPIGGPNYQGLLELPEYSLSFCFLYSVYVVGVMSIRYGEEFVSINRKPSTLIYDDSLSRFPKYIIGLILFSTLMLVCIVLVSGGFKFWWADPGNAFLKRAGSGVFVILSHFSSLTLALISGYYTFKTKKKWPILIFLIWFILTSPVHGSKFLLSVLLVVLFIPWIKETKLLSVKSIILYISFILIFYLGLYFRDFPLKMVLNYFTSLENLAMSIRDFEPSYLKTFFLPFVKFKTPFGLRDIKMYYDMNHMLTDYYYPDVWKIRATQQWPVETDLYLNFKFHFGLPLIALYLGFIGYIYKRAIVVGSLGHWFASIMMTLFMISHLRGSLINHTDFYMYPFIFIVFYIFKNYSLNPKNEK